MLTLWLYICHHRQASRSHRGPKITTLSVRDYLYFLDLLEYECISDHQPCCSKFLYLRLWEEPLHHKSFSPLSLDHVQAAKQSSKLPNKGSSCQRNRLEHGARDSNDNEQWSTNTIIEVDDDDDGEKKNNNGLLIELIRTCLQGWSPRSGCQICWPQISP